MAPLRRFTRSNRPLLKDVQAVESSVAATLSQLFITNQNQKAEALGVVAQGAAVVSRRSSFLLMTVAREMIPNG